MILSLRTNLFAPLFAVWLFVLPLCALAHTILPEGIQEFLRTHPGSTTEEVENWITTQDVLTQENTPEAVRLVTDTKNDKGFFLNAYEFMRLGMFHIFGGIDHILFLVAMMLTCRSLKELMRLTLTFTLAHSITLILSGTSLLSVSGRIVEPIIAFSIAYVAVTSVLLRKKTEKGSSRGKIVAVFLFGLVHGLGFAGLLRDIHIPANMFIGSLIFFNVGIEIGQLALLSVIVPVLLFIQKRAQSEKYIRGTALLISFLGIYWGIGRLGL